jgi:hypothetical protein
MHAARADACAVQLRRPRHTRCRTPAPAIKEAPMRNTRRICVVLLLCGLPVAHGQTANDSTRASGAQAVIDGRVFQRLDANGDGRLTREEARIDAVVAGAFERIDADGNGIVSRSEARRFDEKREPEKREPDKREPTDDSVRGTVKDGAAR